jgi:hypothetical protein
MTPVEFTFITPDGIPIGDALVEVQLGKPGYDEDETGIIVPRLVTGTTNAQGKVVINLWPSTQLYYVTFEDPGSQAIVSYKFYVPALDIPGAVVRLQDIVVDAPMSGTPFDDAALLIIHDAKANAVTAAVTATAAANAAAVSEHAAHVSELSAAASASVFVEGIATVVAAKNAAQASELVAKASEQIAVAKAAEASSSASTAADAEDATLQSMLEAKAAEVEAEAHRVAAEASASGASSSESIAVSAKNTAVNAATAADVSQKAAESAATTAINKATEASSSANSANIHAENANQARLNAQAAESNASGYSASAQANANTATTKAGEAAVSATQAAGSASTATTKATEIQGKAEIATTAAETASTAASTATTKAEEAHQWAITAAAAAEGAVEGQLPGDWAATSGPTRILNKPTIPTSKADFGLGNVENKSSATIRSELTSGNVHTALVGNLTLSRPVNPQVVLELTNGTVDQKRWVNWAGTDGFYYFGTQDDAGVNTQRSYVSRTGYVKNFCNIMDLDSTGLDDNVQLMLKSNVGKTRNITLTTGNSLRWTFGADSAAESGSNFGSNFSLKRYSDTGSFIDSPITVLRTNGNVYINRELLLPFGRIYMQGAANVGKFMYFSSNSNNRWIVGSDNSNESGTNNSGSDFVFTRSNDAGVIIDTPLKISRSTGVINANKVAVTELSLAPVVSTRSADNIFYSSSDNTINKNTAIGMRSSLGLGSVDNTADNDKPVSTAQQTALNTKQSLSEKNTSNGYLGLDGFAIPMRNDAGTVISKVSNTNTAPREYTFPDKGGRLLVESDLDGLTEPPVTGNMVLSPGHHTIVDNYILTLPDLTNPVKLNITSASNALALPSKLTCADGWSVETGFAVGQTKTIAPVIFGNKRGWWGNCKMTPPQLSSVNGTVNNAGSKPHLFSTLEIGGMHLMAISEGSQLQLCLVNPTTGAIGPITQLPGSPAIKGGMYPIDATRFLILYLSAGYINAAVGTINGTTITVPGSIYLGTGPLRGVVKINATQFMAVQYNDTTTTAVRLLTISGNSVTNPAVNYTIATAKILRVAPVTDGMLVIYPDNNTGNFANFYGAVFTASGNTINRTSATSIINSAYSSTNSGDTPTLAPMGNNRFLFGARDASVVSTGKWIVLSVSGTTITLDSLPLTLTGNNLTPVGGEWNQYEQFISWVAPADVDQEVTTHYRDNFMVETNKVLLDNAMNTMLFTYENNTLTCNFVATNTSNKRQVLRSIKEPNSLYMVNMQNDTIQPVTITGPNLSIGTPVAGAPKVVFSNNLNDAAIKVNGIWYRLAGLPRAHHPLSDNKYLSLSNWPLIATYGSMEE